MRHVPIYDLALKWPMRLLISGIGLWISRPPSDFFSCSQPAAPRKAQHSDPAMFMDRRNALFANPFWKYHGQI